GGHFPISHPLAYRLPCPECLWSPGSWLSSPLHTEPRRAGTDALHHRASKRPGCGLPAPLTMGVHFHLLGNEKSEVIRQMLIVLHAFGGRWSQSSCLVF